MKGYNSEGETKSKRPPQRNRTEHHQPTVQGTRKRKLSIAEQSSLSFTFTDLVCLILFNRLDFHVGLFGWVAGFFPVVPIDALRTVGVLAAIVTTVQVWLVTRVVPPGAMVLLGTVYWTFVVVTVFGAEAKPAVSTQWITCVTCEEMKMMNSRNWRNFTPVIVMDRNVFFNLI